MVPAFLLVLLLTLVPSANAEEKQIELDMLPGMNPGEKVILKDGTANFLYGSGLKDVESVAADTDIEYTKDIELTDLKPMSKIYFSAITQELMPGNLQPRLSMPYDNPVKFAENKLTWDTLYRLCAPKGKIKIGTQQSQDSAAIPALNTTDDFIGKDDSDNPYYYYDTIGAGYLGATFFGKNKAAGLDLSMPTAHAAPIIETRQLSDGKVMYIVDPGTAEAMAFQCDAAAAGQLTTVATTKPTGVVRTASIFNVVVDFFSNLFNLRKCNKDDTLASCGDYQLSVVQTDSLAGDVLTKSAYTGVKDDELSQNVPADRRKKLIDQGGGGFLNTYLPGQIAAKVRDTHGQVSQTETTGERKSYPRWLAGVVEASDCTSKDMLLPGSYKSVNNDTYQCPWTGEEPGINNAALGIPDLGSGPPTRGSVNGTTAGRVPDTKITNDYMYTIVRNTALEVGLPVCVLEAIGIVESNFSWGAQDDNPDQCVPNRCAAAGPFQITIGKDNSGDPATETLCQNCTFQGSVPAWIQQNGCPNAWGNNPGSPCSIQASALVAAQKLKRDGGFTGTSPRGQEEAMQRAGYRYFGSTSKDVGLSYKGENLSYGDFIVARCRLFPSGQ